MRKLFAGMFFVIAMFSLSGCIKDGDLKETSTTELLQGHGYVAARMTSNYPGKQYLYFRNHALSETQAFMSSKQYRFAATGKDAEIKVQSVPAGTYRWLDMYFSGGQEIAMPANKTFHVALGKITYLGDINTTTLLARGRARIKVTDNTSAAKKELADKLPNIYNRHPFVSQVRSLH